jgi:hypothetical protein
MTILGQELSITTSSGNTITGEALDTGGVWARHTGLSDGHFLSDGAGAAYGTGGTQCALYGSTVANSADHISSIRFVSIGAAGVMGLVCRLDTGSNSHAACTYNAATDILTVYWWDGVNPIVTEWTGSAGLFTPSTGDWLHFKASGSAFEVKGGNSVYASATTIKASTTFTAGYPTSGQPGIFQYDGASSRIKIDRWTATDVAVAASGDPPLPLIVGDARDRVFQRQHNDYYAPIFISTVGSEVEPSTTWFHHFRVFGLPVHFQQDAVQRFLADRLALQVIKAREAFVLPPPKWTAPILIVGPDSRYQTQAQALRYSYTNSVNVTPTASYTPPVTPPSTLRSKKKGFFFEIWP